MKNKINILEYLVLQELAKLEYNTFMAGSPLFMKKEKQLSITFEEMQERNNKRIYDEIDKISQRGEDKLFCEEFKENLPYFTIEQEDLMKEKGIKFERVYNSGNFAGWKIETEKIGATQPMKSKAQIDRDILVAEERLKIDSWTKGLNFLPNQNFVQLNDDSKKQGAKESDGKLDYELDWNFIEQMAQRMAQNKGKYKPFNWQKPMDIEKLKQSLLRHTIEIMKGNYADEGREFGHFESTSLNAMMINYQLNNKNK